MKIRRINIGIVNLLLFATSYIGRSQGFINLDFEHPVLPLTPVNGLVSSLDAIPGWTAYAYGSPASQVFYNTVSLGAAAVSLQGPGSVETIPQGSYAVILQGSTGGAPGSAAIGQAGQIPTDAQSLIFWGGVGPNDVSINGQILSLVVMGSTPNYNIYGADISAVAGQADQLLFTAPPGYSALIDNIMFSTSPIPEPDTGALILCGTALFALRRWRHDG